MQRHNKETESDDGASMYSSVEDYTFYKGGKHLELESAMRPWEQGSSNVFGASENPASVMTNPPTEAGDTSVAQSEVSTAPTGTAASGIASNATAVSKKSRKSVVRVDLDRFGFDIHLDLKERHVYTCYLPHYQGDGELEDGDVSKDNPYKLPVKQKGHGIIHKKTWVYHPSESWHSTVRVRCTDPATRGFADVFALGRNQKCGHCNGQLRFPRHWNLCPNNHGQHFDMDFAGRQLLGDQPYNKMLLNNLAPRKFTTSDLDAAYDNGHFLGKL